MRVQDKVVVVTGGANGIGRALCRRFAAEGAKAVVVADIEHEAARTVAAEIGGWDINANVASESDIQMLVDEVLKRYGQIDLFCSNAGIGVEGDCCTPDRDWLRSWEVNVMGHVYAARAVLPGMLARRKAICCTPFRPPDCSPCSARRLTPSPNTPRSGWPNGSASPTAIKGSRSPRCAPWACRTRMLERAEFGGGTFLLDDAISPDEVAEAVIQGLDAERFLIAPHPKVLEHFRRKADDYDRWLAGMRRLQASMIPLKTQRSRSHSTPTGALRLTDPHVSYLETSCAKKSL